jgi:hypothetical protein
MTGAALLTRPLDGVVPACFDVVSAQLSVRFVAAKTVVILLRVFHFFGAMETVFQVLLNVVMARKALIRVKEIPALLVDVGGVGVQFQIGDGFMAVQA